MAANINVDKALRVSTERDDDVAVTEVLPKRSHPRSSSSPALACRKIARKSLSKARADLLGRKAAAAGSNDIVVTLTSR